MQSSASLLSSDADSDELASQPAPPQEEPKAPRIHEDDHQAGELRDTLTHLCQMHKLGPLQTPQIGTVRNLLNELPPTGATVRELVEFLIEKGRNAQHWRTWGIVVTAVREELAQWSKSKPRAMVARASPSGPSSPPNDPEFQRVEQTFARWEAERPQQPGESDTDYLTRFEKAG